MKTSWKKTKQWEAYLLQRAHPEEILVVEAELILNPTLRETLQWQAITYDVVRQYSRQQLRSEIQAVQRQLFQRPEHRSFRQTIRQLFSKD